MPVRRCIVAGLAAVVFLAAGTDVYGQRPRWAQPYRDAEGAIKDGRWDDAIRLLTAAIGYDGVQDPEKFEEANYRRVYFPYVLRGWAYLKKNDLANAEKDFTRAWQDVGKFPKDRVAEFNGYKTEFEVREAQGFLDRKQWAEAVRRYNDLRQRNASEFSRLGLGAKREQALKGQGEEIAAAGRALLNDGKISEAKARFTEAEQVFPGTGAQGLRDVTQREDYRKAIADAQTAQQANNVAVAIQNFERAKELHPQQFAAENHGGTLDNLKLRRASDAKDAAALADRKEAVRLVGVGRGLAAAKRYADAEVSYQQALAKDPNNTGAKDLLDRSRQFADASAEAKRLKQQNSLAAASGPVRRAQSLDKTRFEADRELVNLLREIESLVSGSDSLKAGVMSCLQGKWKDAVATLTPLAENPAGLDAAQRAHAHAYLAVSHATGALMATSPAEGEQMRQQAIAQFRQALQLQPGYKLSETMVSPKIRQLLGATPAGGSRQSPASR